MGKDIWNADEYATYFRVLETEDEYFDYYRKRHAFWKMYGLGLPDEVLKKGGLPSPATRAIQRPQFSQSNAKAGWYGTKRMRSTASLLTSKTSRRRFK